MTRCAIDWCTCLLVASVFGMNVLIAAPPDTSPAGKQDQSAAVQKQRSSFEAMQSSIDKQKAAVRAQVGDGSPAASFFTTPWQAPASVALPPPACDPIAESDLASIVRENAIAQNMSPDLIRAVIRRESASYSCAVSAKGAIGLMQLMPETSQQFGADPFDAKQNVEAGSKYLKQLLTRYKGDQKLALAAYNAGPARVDAAGGIPEIQETTAYVDAILKDIESAKALSSVQPKAK
jgi:soluble lytic murein transglycosylase-like protein